MSTIESERPNDTEQKETSTSEPVFPGCFTPEQEARIRQMIREENLTGWDSYTN